MEWLNTLYTSFYNALIPEKRYLAYISGVKITLMVALFAVFLGVLIGILVAVVKVSAKNSKNSVMNCLIASG